MASTNQTLNVNVLGNNNNRKEATIPIPQTLKMILRFLFSSVISPDVFVNKNKELKAKSTKKVIAHAV